MGVSRWPTDCNGFQIGNSKAHFCAPFPNSLLTDLRGQFTEHFQAQLTAEREMQNGNQKRRKASNQQSTQHGHPRTCARENQRDTAQNGNQRPREKINDYHLLRCSCSVFCHLYFTCHFDLMLLCAQAVGFEYRSPHTISHQVTQNLEISDNLTSYSANHEGPNRPIQETHGNWAKLCPHTEGTVAKQRLIYC